MHTMNTIIKPQLDINTIQSASYTTLGSPAVCYHRYLHLCCNTMEADLWWPNDFVGRWLIFLQWENSIPLARRRHCSTYLRVLADLKTLSLLQQQLLGAHCFSWWDEMRLVKKWSDDIHITPQKTKQQKQVSHSPTIARAPPRAMHTRTSY